eukprot:TRINITY_DN19021_c0_g1_i5.p1 TRINITY_DN19021_c0_g1~~TRINITY_DN19021_c0_g1_i5.p1  ORF type:complete len:429 (+),score=112.10 TRINITY_DN19021_c0_g1_i5:34-1320(+)
MYRVVDVFDLQKEDAQLYDRVCQEAAQMLVDQWPSVKLSTRLQSLTQPVLDRKKRLLENPSVPDAKIPCSMVLLDAAGDNKLLGHINIQAAVDHLEGKACIAYAVIISPECRGKGLGKILMEKAEIYAREDGFSIMYLFTPDMEAFYRKCGYFRSPKVSSLGAHAKRLNASQVKNLENLFAKRVAVIAAAAGSGEKKALKDSMLPTEDSVWMRKILVEEMGEFVELNWVDLKSLSGDKRLRNEGEGPTHLKGYYLQVPWQKQVGPSCGLLLIRLLRELLKTTEKNSVIAKNVYLKSESSEHPFVIDKVEDIVSLNAEKKFEDGSILELARKKGFSIEGEMLSSENLGLLVQDIFPSFKISRRRVADVTANEVKTFLEARKVLLVGYDRAPNSQPCTNRGGSTKFCSTFPAFRLRHGRDTFPRCKFKCI